MYYVEVIYSKEIDIRTASSIAEAAMLNRAWGDLQTN